MQKANSDCHTLVLGIGNEILADEGIGPVLVRRLRSAFPHPDIAYKTVCEGGLDILNYIHGYKEVIFIDSIKTKRGIPGDVYFFSPDNYQETLHLSNNHDISFLTALKLGNKLDYPMPESVLIIAIEVEKEWAFGDEFTPIIKKRYEEIFKKINQWIRGEILSKSL